MEELPSPLSPEDRTLLSILERLTDSASIHDGQTFHYTNESAARLLGYASAAELIGTPVINVVHPLDRPIVAARIQALRATGKPAPLMPVRYLRKDSGTLIADTYTLVINFGGRQAILVVAHDITVHTTERERYKALLDSVPGGIVVLKNRTVVMTNGRMTELVGYSSDELIGHPIRMIYHSEESFQYVGNHYYPLLARTGRASFAMDLRRKDGSVFHARLSGAWLKPETANLLNAGDDKEISIWTVEDITDQKRAEQQAELMRAQVLHASKLASIGTLAAGVAHEINNPLAIMLINIDQLSEILKQDRQLDPLRQDRLNHLEHSAKRIASIVSNLRTYARPNTDEVETVDLTTLTRDTLDLLHNIYAKEEISIVARSAKPGICIRGNPGKLQQILMNLISNSSDAIQELQRPGLIQIEIDEQSNFVTLSVSDDGCGIANDKLDLIFDPFYTTKPPGKGTGLGLSIVHSLTSAMNGKIDVRSKLNSGTTFTLRFPR